MNASSGGDSKGYSLAIKIVRRLYRLVCLAFVRNKTRDKKRQANMKYWRKKCPNNPIL